MSKAHHAFLSDSGSIGEKLISAQEGSLSTILSGSDLGKQSKGYHVPTRTVDASVPTYQRIDLALLTAQGHELEILRGMQDHFLSGHAGGEIIVRMQLRRNSVRALILLRCLGFNQFWSLQKARSSHGGNESPIQCGETVMEVQKYYGINENEQGGMRPNILATGRVIEHGPSYQECF